MELATLWREVSDRRAKNMRLLAEELVATGEVPPELAARRIADVLWTLNSPELHDLLVRGRGWSPDELGAWLADAWSRLLLRSTTAKRKGRR